MSKEDILKQLIHTFYLVSICFTSYIFGAFPQQFYYLHGIKTIVYLALRYWSFKKRKYHYYMMDYCYFVNLLSLYVCFVHPENIILQKMLFVGSNGPLALSVVMLKNRVIFHSADHNTSVFIHVSCMLLSYCMRWHTVYLANNDNESWLSFIIWGILLYSIWACIYIFIMFMVLRDRIKLRGNMTMFDWAINQTKLSKLKKFISSEKIQQAFYSVAHGTVITMALIISPVFWYYKHLHFAYVMFILTMSFWNGSRYYVKLEKMREVPPREIINENTQEIDTEKSDKDTKQKQE